MNKFGASVFRWPDNLLVRIRFLKLFLSLALQKYQEEQTSVKLLLLLLLWWNWTNCFRKEIFSL